MAVAVTVVVVPDVEGPLLPHAATITASAEIETGQSDHGVPHEAIRESTDDERVGPKGHERPGTDIVETTTTDAARPMMVHLSRTASHERARKAVKPVAMNPSPGTGGDLRTQLRLGVVMTGGVSLAVWMGGVSLELDRLRREVPGSVYTELCRLADMRPVVDIVAGTSAGGLNGTLLASATAWESDLEDLRSVVAECRRLRRPAAQAGRGLAAVAARRRRLLPRAGP